MAKDAPARTQLDDDTDTPRKSALESLEPLMPMKEVNVLAKQRSDIEGLKQLCYHGAFIAMSAVLVYWSRNHTTSFLLQASALILHGFTLSFVFMPLHECVHSTAFNSPVLNDVVGQLCGLTTMRGARAYRYYHYAHHRYTGDKEKDPELQNSFLDPDIKQLTGYLLYLSGIPFWVDRIFGNLLIAFGRCEAKWICHERARQDVIREMQIYWLIYAALFLGPFREQALWYWFIPSVLGQPFLRFYLLAEHTGCSQGIDMLANTRTTKTWAWYRRLAWNMPYHGEHHAWPQVPFHLLPQLNQHIQQKASDAHRSRLCKGGDKGYWAFNLEFVSLLVKGKI